MQYVAFSSTISTTSRLLLIISTLYNLGALTLLWAPDDNIIPNSNNYPSPSRTHTQAGTKRLVRGKVPHLRVLLKSIAPVGRNASAVLKDLSGECRAKVEGASVYVGTR